LERKLEKLASDTPSESIKLEHVQPETDALTRAETEKRAKKYVELFLANLNANAKADESKKSSTETRSQND